MTDSERLNELKRDIEALKDNNPRHYRELREFVCGLEYTDATQKTYTRLDLLGKDNIYSHSTQRLEHVLKTLNKADELNGCLVWQTGVWENCSIEELIGGLIEAENLLKPHLEPRRDSDE